VKGHVDFDSSELELNQGEEWDPELTLPVNVFGNIIKATRGETVSSEILGSGDASQINQVFKLKKKPLTYLPSPSVANDLGLQNTLRVSVNGIQWKEVPSFFNKKPEDEVYIIRQNDEGDSLVIFGDGIRGKRIPTGTDNVTATYRFGAGAAEPPAGLVNQIAKPVKGLRSVNNPLSAGGGAEAEAPEGIRQYAPRSVLTLGRAVSIPDMEAITAAVSGVRVVQAQWRWQGERQSPAVLIWYIGDEGIDQTIIERLHSVTDPVTPIVIEPAQKIPATIQLDIEIDPRYGTEMVMKQLWDVLAAPGRGLLTPEKLGIGKPIFRSHIFSAALSVEGVVSVRNILWNNSPFSTYAVSPGAGKYFDFGDTGIQINGES
jgi:predicted phage baseplate assembly protein